MNPCDNCNAPIAVHESMGCAGDRLHNAKVDLCSEIVGIFGRIYPKEYQCRYKENMKEMEGYGMNEFKTKLLARIETDIAEGKLTHVTGAKLIRYILQIEDDEE